MDKHRPGVDRRGSKPSALAMFKNISLSRLAAAIDASSCDSAGIRAFLATRWDLAQSIGRAIGVLLQPLHESAVQLGDARVRRVAVMSDYPHGQVQRFSKPNRFPGADEWVHRHLAPVVEVRRRVTRGWVLKHSHTCAASARSLTRTVDPVGAPPSNPFRAPPALRVHKRAAVDNPQPVGPAVL